MTSLLRRLVSPLVASILAVVAARRALFLVCSLLPRTTAGPSSSAARSLLVLVAARNEEHGIGPALAALRHLDYPRESLFVSLVDDGSSDRTGALLEAFADDHSWARTIVLSHSQGKGAALNAGLAAWPPTELVAVCDADQAPRPDYFRRVADAFDDPEVGAATGYLLPANSDASLVARYTAVETWVHQLVTSAAKDRLGLNPPMLGGGAVYRRTALDAIGGFHERAYAEDLASSLQLARAGWRTRFVPGAVVENLVASRWKEYWDQHLRWTRSVYDAAGTTRSSERRRAAQRLEELLQTSGYLDRIVLAGALVLSARGRLRKAFPLGYLALAGAEVVAGVVRAGRGRRLPRYVVATLIVFPVDVAGALVATTLHLARRPLRWQSPRGAGDTVAGKRHRIR